MDRRKIPIGRYIKISRKDINNIADILYVRWGEDEISFVEWIKDELFKKPYTYVTRGKDGFYSFGDTTKNFKPYKDLGEMR